MKYIKHICSGIFFSLIGFFSSIKAGGKKSTTSSTGILESCQSITNIKDKCNEYFISVKRQKHLEKLMEKRHELNTKIMFFGFEDISIKEDISMDVESHSSLEKKQKIQEKEHLLALEYNKEKEQFNQEQEKKEKRKSELAEILPSVTDFIFKEYQEDLLNDIKFAPEEHLYVSQDACPMDLINQYLQDIALATTDIYKNIVDKCAKGETTFQEETNRFTAFLRDNPTEGEKLYKDYFNMTEDNNGINQLFVENYYFILFQSIQKFISQNHQTNIFYIKNYDNFENHELLLQEESYSEDSSDNFFEDYYEKYSEKNKFKDDEFFMNLEDFIKDNENFLKEIDEENHKNFS